MGRAKLIAQETNDDSQYKISILCAALSVEDWEGILGVQEVGKVPGKLSMSLSTTSGRKEDASC